MWSSPDFCGAKSGKNPSICGNGVHLPWKKFSTGFHGIYGCILDSAAAWNFHAHDGNTLDIVLTDDFGELLPEFVEKYEKMFHQPRKFVTYTDSDGKAHLDVDYCTPEE